MPEDKQPDTNGVDEHKPVSYDEIPASEQSTFNPEVEKKQPPVSAPEPTAPVVSEGTAPKTSPGMLVLQWLVYAFWGWTALAVSWLAAMVVVFLFDTNGIGQAIGSSVAYALASTLVLFAISLTSDIFYSKREPLHKTGASMVVMVIHAVIFALFGIGWLIAAVFGGVQLLIGEADSTNSALSLIVTAILVTVVYGVTLLRTLKPFAHKILPRLYWLFMAVVVVVLAIVAVVGPAAQARLAKADDALENGLPNVSRAINTYTKRNDKLPTSLSDIRSSLSSSASKIVDEDKVKYTPKEKLSDLSPLSDDNRMSQTVYEVSDAPVYHYELCVTYAAKSEYYNDNNDYDRYSTASERYDVAPRTYEHPAGEVCYDLQTDYSY